MTTFVLISGGHWCRLLGFAICFAGRGVRELMA
jgi:hypothetical protein